MTPTTVSNSDQSVINSVESNNSSPNRFSLMNWCTNLSAKVVTCAKKALEFIAAPFQWVKVKISCFMNPRNSEVKIAKDATTEDTNTTREDTNTTTEDANTHNQD
jgi:hypothetical protein